MNTDTHTSGSTVKKPHLMKNGIPIQCNTENFVPIVVPGLLTSSSSSLPSSTSMTPPRQEIDHPKSSSSSSTSPSMTSSTVSSESVPRQEQGDPYGMNHHPAIVSSELVERQERGDPYSSETSEELLTKPTKNPNPKKNEDHEQVRETRVIPTYRNGCKNSERILWMTEFLKAETHAQVLLIDYL